MKQKKKKMQALVIECYRLNFITASNYNGLFYVQRFSLFLSLKLYLFVCVCFYLDPSGMGVGFPATHPWNVLCQ